MASQCAYLAYVSTKISHMYHKPSKSSVSTRTVSSLPVSHLPSYTISQDHPCTQILTSYYEYITKLRIYIYISKYITLSVDDEVIWMCWFCENKIKILVIISISISKNKKKDISNYATTTTTTTTIFILVLVLQLPWILANSERNGPCYLYVYLWPTGQLKKVGCTTYLSIIIKSLSSYRYCYKART